MPATFTSEALLIDLLNDLSFMLKSLFNLLYASPFSLKTRDKVLWINFGKMNIPNLMLKYTNFSIFVRSKREMKKWKKHSHGISKPCIEICTKLSNSGSLNSTTIFFSYISQNIRCKESFDKLFKILLWRHQNFLQNTNSLIFSLAFTFFRKLAPCSRRHRVQESLKCVNISY